MIIYEKDKNPLISGIYRDVIQKGENKLISVTGGTQKGKSRLTLALALLIDPNFWGHFDSPAFNIIERLAVIYPIDFMDIMDKPAPRGSVKIYDDAGIGINSQDWHDFQVQKLSRIFHIIGNQGWIVMISTPHYGFINSQVRAVVTDRIVVKGRSKGKIRFKYYSDVNYDERTGKEYKSYPVKIYNDGKKRKIHMFTILEPPEELRNKFYAIESGGKIEYRKESMQEVKKEQEIKKMIKLTSQQRVKEIVQEILLNPEPYIKEWAGRRFIDQSMIEQNHGIGSKLSPRVKGDVEKALGLN